MDVERVCEARSSPGSLSSILFYVKLASFFCKLDLVVMSIRPPLPVTNTKVFVGGLEQGWDHDSLWQYR